MTERSVWIAAVIALTALSIICIALFDRGSGHNKTGSLMTAPPVQSARLQISVSNGAATLSGVLLDDAQKTSALNEAQQAFGENRVVDSIKTSGNVTAPPWLGQVSGLVNLLKAEVDSGSIVLKDKSVAIVCEVASDHAKTKLLRALVKATGGALTVNDQISIRQTPGAARQLPSTLQEKLDRQLRGRRVEFSSGSTRLMAESNQVLDDLIAILRSEPETIIEIRGHTDSQGDEEKNLTLSQRRADAVKKYLVEKGIAANQLKTHGYGASRPISEDESPRAQQQNRRIEFRVLEGK
jgi:OmpA-OmpF porin, OOP family